mmetsp:Transcript_12173/g.35013  ORF Transcript_12173/g.35013 Transcript_12173/m.35013 type:complete len:151 (+) Transcript_12173:173-625(+)|eukprot:scaffold28014_cov33-Tisochrysis_lutea.AAC.2
MRQSVECLFVAQAQTTPTPIYSEPDPYVWGTQGTTGETNEDTHSLEPGGESEQRHGGLARGSLQGKTGRSNVASPVVQTAKWSTTVMHAHDGVSNVNEQTGVGWRGASSPHATDELEVGDADNGGAHCKIYIARGHKPRRCFAGPSGGCA